jgi:hypothetical protein
MTALDVERKLLPLHDSNGLTWYQFEHLVSCLQEDLRYAEMRFHHCVQEIRRRNEVLYCTRGNHLGIIPSFRVYQVTTLLFLFPGPQSTFSGSTLPQSHL